MTKNEERIAAIEQRLKDALNPTAISVIDESQYHVDHPGAASGAGHFAVDITSEAFAGKTPVQAHQMVYSALNELLGPEIHALKIKTNTP